METGSVMTVSDEMRSRYGDVRARLGSAWRRQLVLRAGVLIAWALMAWVGAACVVLGLDWIFAFPLAGRVVLAALGVTGAAFVTFWKGGIPLLRAARQSLGSLSIDLERICPSLESRLVTVLDLCIQAERPVSESRMGFLLLAVRSAHRDMAGVHLGRLVPARGPARLMAMAGCLVAVVVAAAAISPGGILSAAQRFTGMMREYREARARVTLSVDVVETDRVHVRGGDGLDVVAITGSPIEVRIRAEADVKLPLQFLSRASGDLPFHAQDVRVSSGAQIAIDRVLRDTDFCYQMGLTQSGIFRVRVTDYPRVRNVQLRLRLPDYTRVRPQFLPSTDGRIQTLYKTDVEVAVESDKPIQQGVFTIYGQKVVVKGHGPWVTTRFLATQDGEYSVEVLDRDGFRSLSPFRGTVDSLEDLAPTVDVDAPDEVLVDRAAAGGISLRFRAQDDYGVEKIRLVYQVGCLPGVRPSATRSTNARAIERKIDPRRVVSMVLPCGFQDLKLEVGETVTYHLEVEDTDVESGPHIARSKSLRVVVIGRELQDWVELEDEDRWPVDYAGLMGGKQASGLGQPGVSRLVKDSAEKPYDSSPGVSNAVEGYVPYTLQDVFSDYSRSLNEGE